MFDFKTRINDALSSKLIRSLLVDTKKNIWIGTVRGLNKLDGSGKMTTYFYDVNQKVGNDILCIFEDSDHNIWVGTKSNGLFKWEGTEFAPINLLVNKKRISGIHSILEDDLTDS